MGHRVRETGLSLLEQSHQEVALGQVTTLPRPPHVRTAHGAGSSHAQNQCESCVTFGKMARSQQREGGETRRGIRPFFGSESQLVKSLPVT